MAELKEKLDSGAVAEVFGARMDQHVRQALTEVHEMLLYEANRVALSVEQYLIEKCEASNAQVTGDYRRRVEVIRELSFVVETPDFLALAGKLGRYRGRTEILSSD